MRQNNSTFRLWWQEPRIYGVGWKDRSVSFLELFYDLIYVVIVAEMAHTLSAHLDWQGFLHYVFLFYLVWIGWFNGTAYHESHGNNDIRTRLTTFTQMVTIAGMAVYAHNALNEKGYQGFALSYAAFIFILALLWWRTGVHDKDHRVVSQPYSLIFLLISVMYAVSAFLPYNTAMIIWIASIALQFLLPVLLRKGAREIHQKSGQDESVSHSLVERFDLFTILVLGEVFVGVVAGMSAIELTFEIGIIALLSLSFGFSIWWLYFGGIAHYMPSKNMGKASSG
jgi:low temperature requirement protein LtrA